MRRILRNLLDVSINFGNAIFPILRSMSRLIDSIWCFHYLEKKISQRKCKIHDGDFLRTWPQLLARAKDCLVSASAYSEWNNIFCTNWNKTIVKYFVFMGFINFHVGKKATLFSQHFYNRTLNSHWFYMHHKRNHQIWDLFCFVFFFVCTCALHIHDRNLLWAYACIHCQLESHAMKTTTLARPRSG